jgi:lactoylglutathione lyase
MLGEPDEPKIELMYHADKAPEKPSSSQSIGLKVDSLDDIMALLKDNNIPIARGPVSPGPTTRFCYVNDPDGVIVQFLERKPPQNP